MVYIDLAVTLVLVAYHHFDCCSRFRATAHGAYHDCTRFQSQTRYLEPIIQRVIASR